MLPAHPGRILRRELAARGITPETALCLGRYFGNIAQLWMNLQTRYDLAVTEQALGERITAEVHEAA